MNSNSQGCVYFFRHKGLKPIKIGFTKFLSPVSRLNQFNTYAPYGVELIGYVNSKNAYHLEKKLHKKYSKFRLNGEWFDISKEDVLKEIVTYKVEKKKVFYIDKYNVENIFKNLKLDIKIHNDYFYKLFTYKGITKKRLKTELKIYCECNRVSITSFNTNGKRGFILKNDL
jgi:hypothetical protein